MVEAVFWIIVGFCACLALVAVVSHVRDRIAWRRARAIGARMRARDQRARLHVVRGPGEAPTMIILRGRR
jgi:hypothetical protein